MNLYVIELKDRIKVGVADNTENRLTQLLSAGGHGAKDVLNLFEFIDTGIIEQPLIRLFKPFLIERSKHNKGKEWFYKKGLVNIFLDEIKRGTKPCKELIQKIQYENIGLNIDENAIKIYEKIKTERKNIGFPDSVTFENFLKKNKMGYRNMIYHIDKNFKSFTRHPNFTLDEISNSQGVECLKIIKNNTKSEVKKEEIQNLIDGIFNENHEHRDKTISFIRDYFFKDLSINKATKYNLITSEEIRENNKIIKELEEFDEQYKIREIGEIKKIRNPNIRIEHYVKYNAYAFIYKYEILNDEEYVIIKNSKNLQLHYNFMSFKYRGNICTCEFDSNSLPRIKNLLKNSEYVDLTAVKNIEIPEIIEETPKQKRPMKRLTKNHSSISEKNIIHEFESNKLTEFEDYEFNDYGRAVTSVITKQF